MHDSNRDTQYTQLDDSNPWEQKHISDTKYTIMRDDYVPRNTQYTTFKDTNTLPSLENDTQYTIVNKKEAESLQDECVDMGAFYDSNDPRKLPFETPGFGDA